MCFHVGMDWIITGASRGIGRALAVALAKGPGRASRIFVVARDVERLRSLSQEVQDRADVVEMEADLSRMDHARAVGDRLTKEAQPGAVLVHNAGCWPNRRELVDGVERAFAINCLSLLALQKPLLEAERLSRILVVSAGLLVKGRFHPDDTPVGRDFSRFRTYCNTKLAGAVVMRDIARKYPKVDIAIGHPGIVNTDLGASSGLFDWLLRRVKRNWETPETCAARLVRLLEKPRWQRTSGEAPWFFEENEQPWPDVVDHSEQAILTAVARWER